MRLCWHDRFRLRAGFCQYLPTFSNCRSGLLSPEFSPEIESSTVFANPHPVFMYVHPQSGSMGQRRAPPSCGVGSGTELPIAVEEFNYIHAVAERAFEYLVTQCVVLVEGTGYSPFEAADLVTKAADYPDIGGLADGIRIRLSDGPVDEPIVEPQDGK